VRAPDFCLDQAMKPLVIILPLVLALGGVLVYVLAPLQQPVRTYVLISDLLGAIVVGFVLARVLNRRD